MVKSLFAPIADILMMLALQADRNVETKAIETFGLNIVKKKVRRDSPKPVQTTLFIIGMYERSSDNMLPQKGTRRVGENPEYKQLSLWDIYGEIPKESHFLQGWECQTIYAGKDSDILNGGAGDDWLFGDRKDDTLIGGMGGDRFALSANSGIDTVLNFSVGTDKFVLAEGLSFEALRINSTANGTLLQFAATGEVLAQVFLANNAITSLDFVAVGR